MTLLHTLAMAVALIVPTTTLFAATGKQPVKTQQQAESVTVRTVPPEIIVANRPALLVEIDGPPEYSLVKGAEPLLWRVVNTRVLLLKNAGGRHYLHFYDGFLEAGSLNEPWSVAGKVPKGANLAEKMARTSRRKTNLLEGKSDPRTRKKPSLQKVIIPWVYLSMIPAELIVIDGEPDFISIEGTRLFYARNTTSNLFWHQGNRIMYLLVSGFWFRAAAYLGPWEIVPDDKLPEDFRNIPDSSVKSRVKASVPPPKVLPGAAQGTVSGNAWLESCIFRQGPFTAAIAALTPETPQKEWCR